ncbi:MAG: nucleoside triphosphate pyrophosphatase [Pseudomonadales bacterium]
MSIVLASSSRYRAELLERLELPFTAVSPELDETPVAGEAPEVLVARLARGKAEAVARHYTDGLIIGSDQVALIGQDVLGKPGTQKRARAQLARLSGNEVRFLTGLCLINAASGRHQLTVVETPVRFRDLSKEEIADYVAREKPLDCAGAFKSEGLGIALFKSIEGTDPNALIGLPLIELCTMLKREGIPVIG